MAESESTGGGAPFIVKAFLVVMLVFIVWYVSGGVARGEKRLAEGRNALWIRYETGLPSTADSPTTEGFVNPDVVQVQQRNQQ